MFSVASQQGQMIVNREVSTIDNNSAVGLPISIASAARDQDASWQQTKKERPVSRSFFRIQRLALVVVSENATLGLGTKIDRAARQLRLDPVLVGRGNYRVTAAGSNC